MLYCFDYPWVFQREGNHRYSNLSEFWKRQPYQCFAPDEFGSSYPYEERGIGYWPPYALPFIIWGGFLLLVLISSRLMKGFKCLGYQYWTDWLVFMFAVNGSLWFWIIYFVYFEISCVCEGYDHGGWPGFFGYEGFGYYISMMYSFLIAIIVLILFIITIYDMVTMEERKMTRKWMSPEDASEILMALKDTAPRQQVLVEVFHEEDQRPRYGRIEGRQDRWQSGHFEGTIDMGEVVKDKVVTFTEDRDFDYDTWEDPTDYPDIRALLEDHLFVILSINVTVEPGDTTTQRIFESFKRRLVASCAYRDQRISEHVEGILPGMKFTKMVVKRVESISCADAFCFSCCGLWLACLFSVGAIVRALLRKKIRKISINIEKKYFADPANERSYDFEDSIPGGGAALFDGAVGTSFLQGHKNSGNPFHIPNAPMPTHNNKAHYQDVERQPDYWDEKPPPNYEAAIS